VSLAHSSSSPARYVDLRARPPRTAAGRPFTDKGARWIVGLTLAMAGVHILDFFFGWIADIYSSSLAVTVARA